MENKFYKNILEPPLFQEERNDTGQMCDLTDLDSEIDADHDDNDEQNDEEEDDDARLKDDVGQ